jgi:hypothetical protein
MSGKESIKLEEGVKVLLSTPLSSQVCCSGFTLSCLALAHLFQKHSIPIIYNFKRGQALLHLARNEIVNDFMSTDFSHLLMVDADTGFEALDVLKLIAADKDVIGAPITKKFIAWDKVVAAIKNDKIKNPEDAALWGHSPNFVPWEDSDGIGEERLKRIDGFCSITLENDKPFRVSSVGTGLMLIKRKVFEKMRGSYPELEYVKMDLRGATYKMFSYFELTRKKDNSLMSEDISFCHRVNEMGMETWIDPWMKTTHYGQYDYVLDFARCAVFNAFEDVGTATKSK